MSVVIRTAVKSDAKGTRITAVATGNGKRRQSTTEWNDRQGIHANHAAAAAIAANKVTTREQAAKMHHPSGRQRMTQVVLNDGTGTITLDV